MIIYIIMILISIPDEYTDGFLCGSWDNWLGFINLQDYDFTINKYNFFLIESNDNSIFYKLKVDNEYILIDDYLINSNNHINNYLEFNENTYFNGVVSIEFTNNTIKILKNDNILFTCQTKNNLPFGHGIEYNDDGSKLYEGKFVNGTLGTVRDLDNGQQRINAPQGQTFHGHAQHGQYRLGRRHTGQMSRPTRPRDEHLNTAGLRLSGELRQPVRRAMGRNDPAFVGNLELGEDRVGVLHGFPIGFAPHDDGDQWVG